MMNSDISFIGAAAEIKDKICHVMSFLAWFLGAFKGALGENVKMFYFPHAKTQTEFVWRSIANVHPFKTHLSIKNYKHVFTNLNGPKFIWKMTLLVRQNWLGDKNRIKCLNRFQDFSEYLSSKPSLLTNSSELLNCFIIFMFFSCKWIWYYTFCHSVCAKMPVSCWRNNVI